VNATGVAEASSHGGGSLAKRVIDCIVPGEPQKSHEIGASNRALDFLRVLAASQFD